MTQTLDTSRPKARREHRCDMCGRVIRPGETYYRQRNVGDDGLYAWKECGHCTAMLAEIDLWERTGWPDGGYSADDMADFEPVTVREARLKALWRMRWTRMDGSLHEFPALLTGGQR